MYFYFISTLFYSCLSVRFLFEKDTNFWRSLFADFNKNIACKYNIFVICFDVLFTVTVVRFGRNKSHYYFIFLQYTTCVCALRPFISHHFWVLLQLENNLTFFHEQKYRHGSNDCSSDRWILNLRHNILSNGPTKVRHLIKRLQSNSEGHGKWAKWISLECLLHIFPWYTISWIDGQSHAISRLIYSKIEYLPSIK